MAGGQELAAGKIASGLRYERVWNLGEMKEQGEGVSFYSLPASEMHWRWPKSAAQGATSRRQLCTEQGKPLVAAHYCLLSEEGWLCSGGNGGPAMIGNGEQMDG